MRFSIEQDLLAKSDSLKQVLNYLQKSTSIKTTTDKDYIILTLPEELSAKEDKEALDRVLLENTQMRLIQDFFNTKILISPNKDLAPLKALYTNYISSLRISKKFGIKHGATLTLKKEKTEKDAEYNTVDKFAEYLEEKEKKILKAGNVFSTTSSGGDNKPAGTLKELHEKIKVQKETREQLKTKILNEKLKSDYYLDLMNEKVNKVLKNLEEISKFKGQDQLQNEGIELFYQQRLLDNLKLHREVIEKKITSDLYTPDQVEALRVIKDGLEKRINLLLNNKNYVQDKQKEVDAQADDVEFMDVLSQITEVNKTIRKRETQLSKIQTAKFGGH